MRILYIISYRSTFRRVFITACLCMTFDVFAASQQTINIINDDNTKLWEQVNTYVMNNHEDFKKCLKNIHNQGYRIEYPFCCSCCKKKTLPRITFQKDNKRFTLYDYVMSKFTYKNDKLILKKTLVSEITQPDNIDEYRDIDELNYFFSPPPPEKKSTDILPAEEQKSSDI